MKQVRWFVWLIVLSQLFTAFVGRSLNPFAAYIGESFTLTSFQIGFLPTALFVGQFLATLPMGFLADKVATHRLLLLLMSIVGSGFLLLATIDGNYFIALLFIMLAGLGYGGMHPVTNKMLVQLYPIQKIALPMGMKQMSITLGSALSSIVLIAIAEYIGWQQTIAMASLLLLVIGIFVYMLLKPYEETFSSHSATEVSLISQMKKLMKSTPLFFSTLVALILMGIQVTFNTYLLLYLIEIKVWAVYLAGLALACSEIFGALGRVLWGVISDKFLRSNRWIVLFIIALWLPSALFGLHIVQDRLLLLMVIATIGFSLSGFNGIWMNLAVESVPETLSGSASGYSVTFASVGVFIIPPLFGYILDQTSYLHAGAFLACASSLCALIIIVVLFNEKKRRVLN
ncbi:MULTISPECIES: MFS transporter [Solibacillus]|uniref:MFS transporter n=1 Tax=Solibacillus merdavium TaxID=2762218 RepID=A0ABR8XLB6_9BACL|nr:MFS transporter [Solibacillus merdavium]MBD8032736.1 MFS transporter [Solibacillus merdavium]